MPQVQTSATVEASTVQNMSRVVEAAAALASPTETAVSRFARIYTPAVILLSLGIVLVPLACGRGNIKVRDTCAQCPRLLHHCIARWTQMYRAPAERFCVEIAVEASKL